ncbi:aminoglycoside 3-N-acetyltransferase [Orenia metallireducens]|uniref:Aminoglycoside N(3)-acetyltransferase n=1 Tax=Orenia metallireducens TaxID=1413210 RepID=A0A285HXT2_9FIRM|nr:AAC(3) family N-acetyltransferase [Orenia metallireducens]PRX29266.1 aminoglycoside 3-N-acetyltransferase [Orenia metallireducens]SNY40548.1 aminoglycoside 3-N-acetyltransferase [Orenia metallireducens]
MSEGSIISETKEPITINSLYQDLIKLGVNRGDILLVHSSLSSLGWVCGGAQSVITAIMNALGKEGTLVMPAHSGDWSDPEEWENPPVPKEWIDMIYENMPAFEPDKTPTRGMGCIAELFRTFPNTLRSDHPQVSFSANGKYAKEIVEEHLLTPQLGMKSPLGKIHELGAKVLLLGVGYDSCTSFHLSESFIEEMPMKRVGTAMLDKGKKVWKWFDDYDYNSDDFELIGQNFEENIIVHKGKVGNANCKLFDIKDGVDYAKSWLRKYRFSK